MLGAVVGTCICMHGVANSSPARPFCFSYLCQALRAHELFIYHFSLKWNTHADEEVSVQLNTKQGRFCKKNWFLSLTVGHSHVGMSCKHEITSDTDKVTVFT